MAEPRKRVVEAGSPATPAPRFTPPRPLEHLPGQVLIQIEEGAVRPAVGPDALRFTTGDARRLPDLVTEPIEYLRRNAGLKSVQPVFSERRAELSRARVRGSTRHCLAVLSSVADSQAEELSGINLLRLSPKKVTRELLRRVRGSKAVRLVEPAPARWPAVSAAERPAATAMRADPRRNLQWGLRAIRWFDADLPDAAEVLVAVLDSGIDTMHPDLRSVEVRYDHEGARAEDVLGHGTHVAGIIAASANDEAGITGMATCRLAVWKVFPDEPVHGGFYLDLERYLRALRAVELSGARVVNLSLGGPAPSATEELLFGRLERAGVSVVAAMGNQPAQGGPATYPAAYRGVLSVAAVDETRRRAPFSNTGRHLSLSAPGTNVLSTLPVRPSPYRQETEYGAWDGTSMAAPHVSAAAALVAARFPDLIGPEVAERLKERASKLPAMRGRDWTREYGVGLLNLLRALQSK